MASSRTPLRVFSTSLNPGADSMRTALGHRAALVVSACSPLQSRVDYRHHRLYSNNIASSFSRANAPNESSFESLHAQGRKGSGKNRGKKGGDTKANRDDPSVERLRASNMRNWSHQLRATPPAVNRPVSGSPNVVDEYESVTKVAETRRRTDSKASRETGGTRVTEAVESPLGIRERLKQWQQLHAESQMEGVMSTTETLDAKTVKDLSLLPPSDFGQRSLVEAEEEEEDIEPLDLEDVDNGSIQSRSRFFLRAGDLVELSSGTVTIDPEIAVVVAHISGKSLCYTVRGSWVFFRPRNVRISFPNVVPTQLLAPLITYLPAEIDLDLVEAEEDELDLKVPRELGFPIIAILKAFATESEAAYRAYSGALNNAHNILAHETEVKFVTLQDIARMIYGSRGSSPSTSPSALYALHKALTRTGYGFQLDPHNHRFTESFEVRPKSEVRLFNTMEQWIHEYQESLAEKSQGPQVLSAKGNSPNGPGQQIRSFVETARKLVLRSRQTRTTIRSETIGPCSAKSRCIPDPFKPVHKIETGSKFSDTDRVIIAFLESWAGRYQFPGQMPINSLGSLIVRATGLYEGEGEDLGRAGGFKLLQEIGVYSPWEDRNVLEGRLCIPEVAPTGGGKKNENTTYKVQTDLSLEKMVDTMYELRTDFKDLDVYCVDGKGTREVDDGISVERVPGPTPTYWVHVHIAHPTAFIPPHHPISRAAERQSCTIYLPERVHPMLPEALVQSRLSLAENRATLTISARLDEEGDIVETNVTPGIIRKVTCLTPSTLDQVIRPQMSSPGQDSFVLTVGGDLPQLRRTNLQGPQDLSPSQLEDLRMVSSLAAKRLSKRGDMASTTKPPPLHELSVYSGPQRTDALSHDRNGPCFWHGDPIIHLRTPPWESLREEPEKFDADRVVGEMMILACEIAARWCSDRSIPMPYRGTIDVGKDPVSAMIDAKSPASSRTRVMRWVNEKTGELVFDFASTPLPHHVMGLEMYTRATSPLRRYGDMLVHWQMDAALREEARTGRSLAGSSRTDHLPFSKADIDALLVHVRERHLQMGRMRHKSTQHWILQLLVRAAFHGQAALPRTFECFVMAPSPGGQVVYIKLLHLRARLEPTPWLDAAKLEEHDELEVELSEILTYRRKVLVKPIRLIRRAAEQTALDIWRMEQVGLWSF